MTNPNIPRTLEERVAYLEGKVTELHPHTLLYYLVSTLVALTAIGVPAWLSYKNLTWLQETHERDEAANRKIRDEERKRAHLIKMQDITTYLIKRFYEIEKTKAEDKRTGFYHEQIWGLHSEEYYQYKKGLLDKDTYEGWLHFRWRAFHNSLAEEKPQWERLKKDYFGDKRFVTFIDSILSKPESAIAGILESEEVQELY